MKRKQAVEDLRDSAKRPKSDRCRSWSIVWKLGKDPPAETHWRIFSDALKDLGATRFIFQLERTTVQPDDSVIPEGKTALPYDNWHYQGFAKTGAQLRQASVLKRLQSFLESPVHLIDAKPASTAGQDSLEKYCMKRDSTYVSGPWTPEGFKPMPEVYSGKDIAVVRDTPRPFQRFVWELIHSEPDDRSIYWFCNPEGSCGKSKFAKLCEHDLKANVLRWCDYSNAANLAYKAESRRIFIFDLMRNKPQNISRGDTYSAIEAIKDGSVTNTKYETGKVFFDPPHVIVFSNELPSLSTLSSDRLKVYFVTSLDGFYPNPLTSHEVQLFSAPGQAAEARTKLGQAKWLQALGKLPEPRVVPVYAPSNSQSFCGEIRIFSRSELSPSPPVCPPPPTTYFVPVCTIRSS